MTTSRRHLALGAALAFATVVTTGCTGIARYDGWSVAGSDARGSSCPGVLGEVWEMLGLANARMGDWEEAVDWLERAKASPEVVDAWVTGLVELGRVDEARSVLEGKDGSKLPAVRRQALAALVVGGVRGTGNR